MLKLALTQTNAQRSTPFHNGVPLEAICTTTMKNEKNGRKNAENGRRKMLNAESVKAMYKNVIPTTNANALTSTRYSRYSSEDRIRIAKEAHHTSVGETSKKYGVKESSIYTWMRKAEIPNKSFKKYSEIEKKVIVEYSYKHGLVKAKEKFGAAQQTICNWRKDY